MAALKPEELNRLDAYWRAANYLSVGQIYLLALDHGGRGRPIRRHDHGVHAARRADDGDPLRLGGPGVAPPPSGAPWPRRRRTSRRAHARFLLGVRRGLGAMAGVLGGVDAVVFTGGIGENSGRVRRDAAGALAPMGLELDGTANDSGELDRGISRHGTRVRALVIRAREDLAILGEVLRLHPSGAGRAT